MGDMVVAHFPDVQCPRETQVGQMPCLLVWPYFSLMVPTIWNVVCMVLEETGCCTSKLRGACSAKLATDLTPAMPFLLQKPFLASFCMPLRQAFKSRCCKFCHGVCVCMCVCAYRFEAQHGQTHGLLITRVVKVKHVRAEQSAISTYIRNATCSASTVEEIIVNNLRG